MAAAVLLRQPVFLTLTTTEPGGGKLVRVEAERERGGQAARLERLVRAPRLTLSQSRHAGVTNAQLDSAPEADEVLQDLIEFSEGADAWIVPHGESARAALREAARASGFPGLPGPMLVGMDELSAVVLPRVGRRGLRDIQEHYRSTGVPPVSSIAGHAPEMRQGAHLPHLTLDGSVYFVTFRLADSLPMSVLQELSAEQRSLEKQQKEQGKLPETLEKRLQYLYSPSVARHLDAGYGACHLRNEKVAAVVAESLRHFHQKRYDLIAWCVMPNHVHVIVKPRAGHSLPEILHSWKSYSAKEANKLLSRSGEFWQEEYYDHVIRDDGDLNHLIEYTMTNPERSGIVGWKWRELSASGDLSSSENVQAAKTHGRDAHATTLRELFSLLTEDLLKLPLPLLSEMNWLLNKSEHPLKKLLKMAEGVAVKNQFSDTFSSGKMALEKLFQDFSPIIDRLTPDGDPDAPPPPPKPVEPLSKEEVARVLGPDGPLAKGLDGYEERPEQVAMAEKVAQSLSDGKHLLVEAGTGVGKSLAYLVPAVLFAKKAGRPLVISTHTKNLQSQLFNKDLPFLRRHLGVDFEAALLKGRPNYLCLRKFMYTLQEASSELDDEERAQMLPIMTWATQTDDGDSAEMAAFSPEQNHNLWSRLHTVGDDCLKRQCPFYSRCFVYKARGMARGADVVVSNHSLVFSDLNLEAGSLPQFSEIVFDEAHKLEDVATEHLACEVTPRRVYTVLSKLYRTVQGATAGKGLLPALLMYLDQSRNEFDEATFMSIRDHILAAMQAVQPATDGSDYFFNIMREWTEQATLPDDDDQAQPFVPVERGRSGVRLERDDAPQNRPPQFRKKRPAQGSDERKRFSSGTLREPELERFDNGKEAAIATLGRLRQALEKLEDDFKEIRKRSVPRSRELIKEIQAQNMFLTELIGDIEFVIKGEEPNYVYWSERLGRRAARVVAAPLDVAPLLHEQLYEKKRSIILASATLSVRDVGAGEASGLSPYFKSGLGKSGQAPSFAPKPLPEAEDAAAKPHPKSFEFLKNRLGLSLCEAGKLDELLLGSPFDYAQQCRLFIPAFLPEPGGFREKEFGAAFNEMLAQLALASNGRALVLYTSYAALEHGAVALRKMLEPEGFEILAQGADGSRESLLERLRHGERTVLLGTASFWEGIDVRGEALSLLVIAKLPFAVFTDPIVQGRCELLEASGKDAFLHFSVPNAILRLRQGFGRLIRSKSDKGIVVLADKRVLTKRYGPAFLRSLPAQAHTATNQASLVSAVREFLETEQK